MTSKFLNQAQRELIEKEFREIFSAVKECCFLEDSIFAVRSIQDTELFKKHCSRFDLFNILEHIYNARSLYNFDWTAAITKLAKEKENAAVAMKRLRRRSSIMTNMKSETTPSTSTSHDRGLSRRMTIVFKENNSSGSSLSKSELPTPRDLDVDSSRTNKAEEILNQLQLDNKDKETGANISKFIRLLIKRELDQLENQLLQKSLKTYEDKIFDENAQQEANESMEANIQYQEHSLKEFQTLVQENQDLKDEIRNYKDQLFTLQRKLLQIRALTEIPKEDLIVEKTSNYYNSKNNAKNNIDYSATAEKPIEMKEHEDGVISMTVSVNEGNLITGSWDANINLWDISRQEKIDSFTGHKSGICSLVMLDDPQRSELIVSGSDDSTIKIWESESGDCLQTMEGHASSVLCVLVMRDRKTLASSSFDKTIRLWDIETNQCLRTLKKHSNTVEAIISLPDSRLVSASFDKTLRFWDTTSGKCLNVIEAHKSSVNTLLLLPDGNLLSGSDDTTLKIWDLNTMKCLHTLEGHVDSILCGQVINDRVIASGSSDSTLRLWDLSGETPSCINVLQNGTSGDVCSLTVLPDGTIVNGAGDGTVRLWKFPTANAEASY
eukprot:TRINITY_DN3310_c0_g1_i1.p1 TRINITY_DN3310_c0_g1~~TRINITY_DN3310_c0_g1_i1.p1  ORF type:complete len:608 (+),score=107.28 TRINITY_DN3310_c0_g1_i1:76-1899(+)